MEFKFKKGKHKTRSFGYVVNTDPLYIMHIREQDPDTYASLTKKQKQSIDEVMKSLNHLNEDIIISALNMIETGMEKDEVEEAIAKKYPTEYKHDIQNHTRLAIKKFNLDLQEKRKETAALHIKRYEDLYEEAWEEFKNPKGKTQNQRFHYKIDKLVLCTDILSQKEQLMGLSRKVNDSDITTIVTEREKENKFKSIDRESKFRFTNISFDEMHELISLIDKMREDADETIISIEDKTPFVSMFGIKDDDFLTSGEITEDVDFSEVDEEEQVKTLKEKTEKKKQPTQTKGKSLESLKRAIVEKETKEFDKKITKKKNRSKLFNTLKNKK